MKLADENNAAVDSGGWPCFTRSSRLNVCNGLLASLAISLSAMTVGLGGWDHLWAEGEG